MWLTNRSKTIKFNQENYWKYIIMPLGFLSLINILYFIQHIDIFFEVMRNYAYFQISSPLIVILISGFGIKIAFLLLDGIRESIFLLISLVYSALFFILQLIITIIPSASACKCTTLSEAILNIHDWTAVELSLTLAVFNVTVCLLFQKFKNSTIMA